MAALFAGANWIPQPGPTLGKASLMAADARNSGLAFGILFVFGMGAAVPWIVPGRVIRFPPRAVAPRALDGMAGKRIPGVTLLPVAIPGISGLDVAAAHWLDTMLPAWTRNLAMTF